MSLFRCTQLFGRQSGNRLKLIKHSTVYYSNDTKSSDDGGAQDDGKNKNNEKNDTKSTKQTNAAKSISADSQNRLNDLLKKLSSQSSLGIVKNVQASKPHGYRKIRQDQKLDGQEQKPKNIRDAAKAVAKELKNENIEDEILGGAGDKTDFLEFVFTEMNTQ